MKVGDTVLVLGYPGAADINPEEQFPVESTLTQGDLSARKMMPGGWSALQTSAEINHGNSGGPAFNDRGEVIGIATFGSRDEKARGINFLVPISVVKEFLNEMSVKPQQSRLSQLHQEGVACMSRNCFKGALEKFKEVSDLSPGFPFVQDKITQSRNAIDQGLNRCWMPTGYSGTGLGKTRIENAPAASIAAPPNSIRKTVLLSQKYKAPVVGWLVALDGQQKGEDFRVRDCQNTIGSDAGCEIVLTDSTISAKHAYQRLPSEWSGIDRQRRFSRCRLVHRSEWKSNHQSGVIKRFREKLFRAEGN